MKVVKYFALAVLVFCVSGVLADAANVLVSFSTTADFYADGKPVVDGEWYVLCWSKDGVFDGIAADCTPYDANDKVLLMAKLAENGHCPDTVFQVDSKTAPINGKYCVLLLDTRDGEGNAADAVDGKPARMNKAIASASYTAKGIGPSGSVTPGATAGAGWDVASVDTTAPGFKPAKISSIEVVGANVKITVSDMFPGVRYNVKMGQDIKNIKEYGLTESISKGEGESTTFFINKEDAKFFKVVREPLAK